MVKKRAIIDSIWKQRLRTLLPDVCPLRGNVFYIKDDSPLLKGIAFDLGSMSPDWFYVAAFVQPLYVPATYVTLSHGGGRLKSRKSDEMWHLREEEQVEELVERLVQEAVPELRTWSDFAYGVHRLLADAEKTPANCRFWHHASFGFILLGEDDRAKALLDRGIAVAAADLERRPVEWLRDVQASLVQMSALLQEDPEAARTLLTEWQRTSRIALGLDPAQKADVPKLGD